MASLFTLFLGVCLVIGVHGIYEQVFSPQLMNSAFQPNQGGSDICATYSCLPYRVIQRRQTYERRRYEAMTVVVGEDSESWLTGMMNYFKIKGYFEEAENANGTAMRMTFPFLTPVNASAVQMTIMAIPPTFATNPPIPTRRTLRIDWLPAMEVYVRSYTVNMFGSEHQAAIDEFKRILGPNVLLASDAAFVVEYNQAYQMKNRRAEIWLIASYPSLIPRPPPRPQNIPSWLY